MSLNQFVNKLLEAMLTADYGLKTEILGAIGALQARFGDVMSDIIHDLLIHILNKKSSAPSLQVRAAAWDGGLAGPSVWALQRSGAASGPLLCTIPSLPLNVTCFPNPLLATGLAPVFGGAACLPSPAPGWPLALLPLLAPHFASCCPSAVSRPSSLAAAQAQTCLPPPPKYTMPPLPPPHSPAQGPPFAFGTLALAWPGL